MNPFESYVQELARLLHGRLPKETLEARLRETRAHLRMSAEEVGEAEAVRRYGRPRGVANEIVREHRGYGTRSVWSLTLPLAAAYLVAGCAQALFILLRGLDDLSMAVMRVGWGLGMLFVAGFFARVVQTRRWLAIPMAASHVVAGAFLTILNHLRRPATDWTWREISTVLFWATCFGATWIAINAVALGTARLLDRGGVRRAR